MVWRLLVKRELDKIKNLIDTLKIWQKKEMVLYVLKATREITVITFYVTRIIILLLTKFF